ncbi:MAG: hypothetical protein M0R03_21270, partial [Novosphingobium sp.]|nr:hypothetical protein [Novosphingobium sp.]
MKKTYSKILKIKPAGKSKVYDFTVKDTHRILANNFYTSNCHISHPDILAFIMKKDDLTKVTGANVSVKVTNEFMEAVEHDRDFYLSWPIQKKQPEIRENLPYNSLHILEDGTHVRRIKAKELWNTIVHQAHKNAEPGVLFWDNVIDESPADAYAQFGFVTKGTNPCITGDTIIAVADGRNGVSIKELVEEGKDVPVYSTNINTGKKEIKWARNPRLTQKNAEVWELTLDDGSKLKATPDHKILTSKLEYKELKDLNPGDSISPFYTFDSNGYRQISGIGAKMAGGNFRNRRQYQVISEFFNGLIDHKKYSIHHKDFNPLNDSIDNLKIMLREDHVNLHADLMKGNKNPYHKMSDEWKFNFASHPGKKNPRFINKSNGEILEVGKLLFKKYGKITRKIWTEFAKNNNYPIKLSNEFRFKTFSNFKNQVATNHKVQSIKFIGNEDVYNITVDDNHNYHVITSSEDNNFTTSSGICIKNCGEVPLSPFDSCRLGSLNIFSFVDDPFTLEAEFRWDKLGKKARIAQRFMDDIVELEAEKIQVIIDKIEADPEDTEIKRTELNTWKKVLEVLKKGRRTGVGILGLGDAMAALGIKFGSLDATKFAEDVQKCIAINSYKETVNLAKERGAFTVWDADIEASISAS